MKVLSKRNKIKAFISHNMTDLIIFLDNNRKSAIYTGETTTRLYKYLEMIEPTTNLTYSSLWSYHFDTSSSTIDDKSSLHPVIADLSVRHKIIWECCGRIGHKTDSCITRGPNLIPTSIRIKMNQSNALHVD